MSKHPLACHLVDGKLVIEVGMDTLKVAAEAHPALAGDPDEGWPRLEITDIDAFAREVERALNVEAEDGSTKVTAMLDAAIEEAVEMGAEGIEWE